MTSTERILLERVEDVTRSIDGGDLHSLTDALYSLASLLFTVHQSPDEASPSLYCKMFYGGAAFPTLARVLLYDVAEDWLPSFPIKATQSAYDVFFLNAPLTQLLPALLPCLHHTKTTTVCNNAQRLLLLCLLRNDGFIRIIRDFSTSLHFQDLTIHQLNQSVSHVAQLITSVPDRVRQPAPTSLSSHILFRQIIAQLLDGANDSFLEEGDKSNLDVAVMFIGELISRICRRGSADVLLTEIVPRILRQVTRLLSEASDMNSKVQSQPNAGISFWSKIMQSIKDPYSVERMSEQLLHYLAAQSATDAEAYWVMWVLYHHVYKHQPSIRSMFTEKFLLWKVFPVRCLSWIIHFAIIEKEPGTYLKKGANETRVLLETVQRVSSAWSKQEFVQSASVEQQVYVTAALGLCIEKMSKNDLDLAEDAMPSILKGVSCRLESADYMIRKMASNIALVFSKAIDPQNPLYLDDSSHEDPVDWEFGKADKERKSIVASASHSSVGIQSEPMMNKINHTNDRLTSSQVMREKKPSEIRIIDPDEIVDPADLPGNLVSDEDRDYSSGEESDTSSDSSLQPYDLSDDGADLKKKFSQIVDVVAALRKSDDADAVEGALDVVERLIRASPDELRHVANELVRRLINVRCSDSTVEGEEESTEEKRQKALVALVVACPLESLDTLNKLLYSPNLDVSQRIMILDIMTDAANELACSKVPNPGNRPATLISSVSDQPWFIPRNIGPTGSSSWRELSSPGTVLNWSHSYERELPSKPGQAKQGKTRRWSLKSSTQESHLDLSQNKFPQYAAAFMLPAMQGFDKRRHGVDLLGSDFIVLGKLIYMLGICMKCAAMHPEASVLASPLLDMLSSRAISLHKEAYVRRAVLFAASCTLVALRPSFVASALSEGNSGMCNGLEWIRTFSLRVAESDVDRDCYAMAIKCLQLHSEMALQVSRALESTQNKFGTKGVSLLPSTLTNGSIRIPH